MKTLANKGVKCLASFTNLGVFPVSRGEEIRPQAYKGLIYLVVPSAIGYREIRVLSVKIEPNKALLVS